MGCSSSHHSDIDIKVKESSIQKSEHEDKPLGPHSTLRATLVIQKFFRRYKARMEIRRRCSWKIFQEIEYSAEQDQINLYNFFNQIVSNADEDDNHRSASAHTFADLLGKTDPAACDIEMKNNESFILLQSTVVPATYAGPHVTFPLTLESVHEMLEHFKTGKTLHEKYVKLIIYETTLEFKKLPNVSTANINMLKKLTIVGDLHGKLDDLLTIFHKNGLPSMENSYVFNGDFIDRGKYGFTKELTEKYQSEAGKIQEFCRELFAWLPLATVISNKILVVHGGLSDRTELDRIKRIRRDQFSSVLKPSHISLEEGKPSLEVIQEWEQILDLLWSDPQARRGKKFNKHRGGGCCFGPDITKYVLQAHGWDLLIRSHECKFEGYDYTHNKKVLTIFSASSYYTTSSNYGAYITLDVTLKPRIIQFAAIKASQTHSKLTESVGVNEESALTELKEKLYSNKEELMRKFEEIDTEKTGVLSLMDWTNVLEDVLQLKLPWNLLRHKIASVDSDGMVLYESCVRHFKIQSSLKSSDEMSLSQTLYKHRHVLETVFRIMDKDCSGLISAEEFAEGCHMLNKFTNEAIPESRVNELAKSLDINKDGLIDFNEFLEAFRLVSSDSYAALLPANVTNA